MKSGTSFFHKGIAANLLKRCWPVWSCYLAFLLLLVPVSLFNGLRMRSYGAMPVALWIEQGILQSGRTLVFASFGVSIIVVMAMYSFLYNSRTCGMMNAFPVRRDTVFSTAWLSGILPLLAANLLTALITLLAFAGQVNALLMLRWFLIVSMGNIAFYGFGCFCAMLTGSLFILPLVYAVLSFTAVVVEYTLQTIVNALVYGANGNGYNFDVLSPLACLMSKLQVTMLTHIDAAGRVVYEEVQTRGTGYLIGYFIAGLLFTVFALLLYRRRRMETASDTVAISILKPVFRYCMAFGCALVLAAAVYEMFLEGMLYGKATAIAIALLMLLGAFIGWFAAGMLIKKSVRVFGNGWKGFFIVAAVCLVFVICAETDITGYEKRLPERSEITTVHTTMYTWTEMKEPENIDEALALQKDIIANEAHNEAAEQRAYFNLHYVLKDGREFTRQYPIARESGDCSDPASDICRIHALENSVEAVLRRNSPSLPLVPENVYHACVYNRDLENRENRHPEIAWELGLTAEEAVALYEECIVPDILAGRLADSWIEEIEGEDAWSGVAFDLELRRAGVQEPAPVNGIATFDYWASAENMDYLYISIPETATLTLARLAELSGRD